MKSPRSPKIGGYEIRFNSEQDLIDVLSPR